MAVHSVPDMMHSQGGYNEELQEVTQGLYLPNPRSEEKDDQSSKGDKLLLVLNIIFNLLSSCHCCQPWNKADAYHSISFITHTEKYMMESDFAFTNNILSKDFRDCKINYLKKCWNVLGTLLVNRM
jgi:hypothetical protein